MHTMTFDNDKGFANHFMMENALQVNTYFTRPYTSQIKEQLKTELDSSEDSSQKKTDLSTVADQQVKQAEQYLNNRPVRKFNYKIPNQVL